MLKVLLAIAALIATFAVTGLHAASAHASAASVASEVAAIRAFQENLGPTEDISTVPLSVAFSHIVIVESDRWAIVSRDPQGVIWVSSDATEPLYLGPLSSPIPAGSEVVGPAYGFAGDRLVPAINAFIELNIAGGIAPDPISAFLESLPEPPFLPELLGLTSPTAARAA